MVLGYFYIWLKSVLILAVKTALNAFFLLCVLIIIETAAVHISAILCAVFKSFISAED